MNEVDISAALARLEEKVDRLTQFSGWVTGDGMPLTVAEYGERQRLDHVVLAPQDAAALRALDPRLRKDADGRYIEPPA